ncbi:MAG: response regulator transcription factor [Clostridia bacterium]|nr:response regulator transcription factor [Clostridia bacterium]
MAKILIAEDEKSINDLIKKNLRLVGHECRQVFDGEEAVAAACTERFDLLILDVMLPFLSGFEVITQTEDIPVIFVTARGGLDDRLRGLRLGGDDYIVKPFEMLELLARVEAVLRRTHGADVSFEIDGIKVDFGSRKVFRDGTEVSLKPKEYDLLELLIRNRNVALSREKIISLVWEFDYEGDTRTVDVHIQQLRQKLGLKDRIKTIYKTGYRFDV